MQLTLLQQTPPSAWQRRAAVLLHGTVELCFLMGSYQWHVQVQFWRLSAASPANGVNTWFF
jgi:hypothetical protein